MYKHILFENYISLLTKKIVFRTTLINKIIIL
jgi:hypothetical protein